MRALALIIFALLFAMPVQAGFTGATSAPAADGRGGFTGPGATNNTTVQAAKGMRDDTHVTLTGNIVSASAATNIFSAMQPVKSPSRLMTMIFAARM